MKRFYYWRFFVCWRFLRKILTQIKFVFAKIKFCACKKKTIFPDTETRAVHICSPFNRLKLLLARRGTNKVNGIQCWEAENLIINPQSVTWWHVRSQWLDGTSNSQIFPRISPSHMKVSSDHQKFFDLHSG